MATKKATSKKATTRKPAAKTMSAINAAAKVLTESKEPLTAKQMIEQINGCEGLLDQPRRQDASCDALCGDTT